jgi:acetylornithine deacetylase/succinyl-diaminopimelate desuccinylase-like protein
MGPGDIELAHTEDEEVGLDETVRAAEVFVSLIDRLPELVTGQ